MRTLTAGPFGVLLEFDDPAETQRCYAAIQRMRYGAGSMIVDVVPAERTVLMISTFDQVGQKSLRDVVERLTALAADGEDPRSVEVELRPERALALEPEPEPATATVELPVRYDGPDLDEVSTLTGLPPSEIIRRHTETEFIVAFTGFAPGFAYLAGLPDELTVPRRTTPRTRVEAGAVGLAGPYTGVYPRASPGGWQIIGHLAPDAEPLWDTHRDPPALLRPGTRVRFRRDTRTG